MDFTTSDGEIISDSEIRCGLSLTIKGLKLNKKSHIVFWEKEFLEWFLDKTIENRVIELNQHITEEELEQLEQLLDYLEL